MVEASGGSYNTTIIRCMRQAIAKKETFRRDGLLLTDEEQATKASLEPAGWWPVRPGRVSKADVDLIVADYQSGSSIDELGEKFQRTRDVIFKALKQRGVEIRKQPLSDEKKRKVLELRSIGLTYKEIGLELGISKSTVYDLVNRAGNGGTWMDGRSKLSDEQRQQVYDLYAKGVSRGELQKRYGVSHTTIKRVIQQQAKKL